MRVVAPLAQVSETTKLQKISPAVLNEEIKHIKQTRAVREERRKVEENITATAPRKPTDPPRAAKIQLPKQAVPSAKVEVKTPPAPKQPKSEPRSLPKSEPIPPPVVVPKTQPKTDAAPKVNPKPKIDAKPKAQPKPLPKGEPQPAPKAEPKAQPKPPPAPKVEPKPAPKPEGEPKPPPPRPKDKGKKVKGDDKAGLHQIPAIPSYQLAARKSSQLDLEVDGRLIGMDQKLALTGDTRRVCVLDVSAMQSIKVLAHLDLGPTLPDLDCAWVVTYV